MLVHIYNVVYHITSADFAGPSVTWMGELPPGPGAEGFGLSHHQQFPLSPPKGRELDSTRELLFTSSTSGFNDEYLSLKAGVKVDQLVPVPELSASRLSTFSGARYGPPTSLYISGFRQQLLKPFRWRLRRIVLATAGMAVFSCINLYDGRAASNIPLRGRHFAIEGSRGYKLSIAQYRRRGLRILGMWCVDTKYPYTRCGTGMLLLSYALMGNIFTSTTRGG